MAVFLSLYAVLTYVGIFAFKRTNISSSLHGLVSVGKDHLLSVTQIDGITAGNHSHAGLELVAKLFLGLQWDLWSQACYQGHKQSWTLSGLWMDGTDSRTLFSRAVVS